MLKLLVTSRAHVKECLNWKYYSLNNLLIVTYYCMGIFCRYVKQCIHGEVFVSGCFHDSYCRLILDLCGGRGGMVKIGS